MKYLRSLFILSLIVVTIFLNGCANSGGSTPTAPTLTITKVDATTANIAAGGTETAVNPTVAFLLTFLEEMGGFDNGI